MNEEIISQDVKEYLGATDAMCRAGVIEQYPDIENKMKLPATRESVLAWLSSEFAWKSENAAFTANCIDFLYPQASDTERTSLKPFLIHFDSQVRLKTYDYFVVTYFPDKNVQALHRLLESMLVDDDNGVRISGIRYVERIGAEEEYLAFFKAWQFRASLHGWSKSESAEIIAAIINKYEK